MMKPTILFRWLMALFRWFALICCIDIGRSSVWYDLVESEDLLFQLSWTIVKQNCPQKLQVFPYVCIIGTCSVTEAATAWIICHVAILLIKFRWSGCGNFLLTAFLLSKRRRLLNYHVLIWWCGGLHVLELIWSSVAGRSVWLNLWLIILLLEYLGLQLLRAVLNTCPISLIIHLELSQFGLGVSLHLFLHDSLLLRCHRVAFFRFFILRLAAFLGCGIEVLGFTAEFPSLSFSQGYFSPWQSNISLIKLLFTLLPL